MRFRRTAALVISCAVPLAACGGERAPEFGAEAAPEVPAADPTAAGPTTADSTAADLADGAGVMGQAAGELLQVTSRTAGDTIVDAPPGPADDPAVRAICDRTAIYQITAGGVRGDASPGELAQLDRSMTQLLQDGSLLYGAVGTADEARLTRCLDLAVDAAPQGA